MSGLTTLLPSAAVIAVAAIAAFAAWHREPRGDPAERVKRNLIANVPLLAFWLAVLLWSLGLGRPLHPDWVIGGFAVSAIASFALDRWLGKR
jgi:hypothetical protein